jgi:predicted CoA-binding protein
MPSAHERFWDHESFAFVGHSSEKPFPELSFSELRKQGRRVFAIDASTDEVGGDRTYPGFDALPDRVEAAVLEVPREETLAWIDRAADAGIRSVWIHMGRDTPEALARAKERGIDALTGTCAVMYVKPGFSYHTLHKWVSQLTGSY